MRILGGWIALTPELAAKLLFGRHVWDCAQHADLLGQAAARAARAGPAVGAGQRRARRVHGRWSRARRGGRAQTIERIAGVYRVLKPHLATVLRAAPGRGQPRVRAADATDPGRAASRRSGATSRPARWCSRDSRAPTRRWRTRARAWERRAARGAARGAGGVTGDVEAPLIVPPGA